MSLTADELQAIRTRAEAATEILGAAGYFVTREGAVISCGTNWRGYGGRRLAIAPNSHGYASVRITRNGRRSRVLVHLLVAEAFLPPKPSLYHQVRHKNGRRMDPRADNLEWGTAKDNAVDRDRHGTTASGDRNGMRVHPESRLVGSRSSMAILDESKVAEIRRRYVSGNRFSNAEELSAEFGVKPDTIQSIARGRCWKHVVSKRTG